MESVFSRAYHYRERESKSNLENYLIEIFTFCLENDLRFREGFLELLNISKDEDFEISTQSSYDNYGRPDIEIQAGNAEILIECKVEAGERPNQLEDYASILREKSGEKKILIFITKYYDGREYDPVGIKYENIKWWDIYQLINDDCDIITQQLKQFLKENDIAVNKNLATIYLCHLPDTKATFFRSKSSPKSTKNPCNYCPQFAII